MNSNPARQRGHLSLVHKSTPRYAPDAVPALYAILTGRIPARDCDRMQGGRGSGKPCAVCGKTLEPFDIEFALEFDSGEGAGTYRVHAACCMAWEMELP